MKMNGFVLAGGQSTRMGRDKALLRLGNTPLILRAAKILRPFVSEVILLAPPKRYRRLWPSVLPDRWPNQGPLGAVCTGLLHSNAEWNVFLACDIPLVSRRFLELLTRRVGATSADAVVPRAEGEWQPFSAAYHARCRQVFVGAFEEGERSVVRLLERIGMDVITPAEMLAAGLSPAELTNVNTPQEWERVKLLSRRAAR
jgi:molybdopterin-guanine dinucleotide biosynthesis protein A